MTESPSNQEGFGPPAEEDIDSAKVKEQVASNPDDVPNAPNRDPAEPPDGRGWHRQRPEPVDPARPGSPREAERDPERRAKPAPEDPEDRPGPLNPGEEDRDRPTGVESFERPGRDGNWGEDRSD